MAENTIDTLSLEIKSSASSAVSSIDKLAESLKRLRDSIGGVDYARFANIGNGIKDMGNAISQFAANVKTADFTRIATGLNKLAGVNVRGVSDASRAISTLTANLSTMRTISFDSQGVLNIANAIAQLGRKTVTQAADNIPRLTTALSGMVTELNRLQSVTFDTTGLSNLVSSITKLGGKAAGNAIPNIRSLGVALSGMMQTLSRAPTVSQNLIQMTQALAQLASNGNRVSTISAGIANGLGSVGTSAGRAKKQTFSLAAAFGKFYATYWLVLRGFRMFKKAIDISSDLTEVQNVVDVTFGDMAQKVEDLSKVSIRDFGMSELTAKQISSRFQAMGVAMGFAQDEMSDMSIELTKLAADMASFYNVEQEAVAESLASIFTGQTRPLRQYGLDLTQATLQEWALAQGMDVNIKKMSQAEKTMLRYQYVLANTTAAQNDFSRTSGTWANQTRILAQSFEQLGSVIGGALINAFKPLVAWLNRAMQSIIAFAQTVVNALGKIFGWAYEIKGGGVANEFEGAGAGAEEMADGTGKAKDNLKDMQKYIAAWHEVNNMTTKDDDAGGGKGGEGGAGGALGDAASGQLVRTEGLLDKYKSDIDSLYELGDYIGKVLTKAMNGIDWESIYQGARNFGKGLADFLNGLISPQLFGAVGRTIAGALNTAIYAALSFGETFDWKDFGLSIATGINEFFNTFDFASLAKTVNVWAKGILDTIITVLDKTNWKLMGEKIGTFLAGIDLTKILGKVGKAIWKALNAAFDTYSRMFEVAPFETALLSLVGVTKVLKVEKFQALINIFSKGFTVVGTFFGELSKGTGILGSLALAFPKLGKVLTVFGDSLMYVITGIRTMGAGGLIAGISAGFANISQSLTVMQKGIISVVAAFAEFAIFKNVTKDMALGTENMISGLVKLAATAGIAGVALSAVFTFPAGAIAAGIIGLTGALVGMNAAQNEIAENSSIGQFSDAIDELSENVSRKTEEIRENLSGIKDNIENSGSAQSNMARDLAAEYEELANKSSLSVNEQIRMKEITEQLAGIVPGLSSYINEQTGLLEIQKDTLDGLIENMDLYARKQAAEEMLTEAYKEQFEAQRNVQKAEEGLKDAREEFISGSKNMSDAVKNMIRSGDIKGLYELANAINDGTSEFNSFEEAFGDGIKKFSSAQKIISNLRESTIGYEDALSDANAVLLDAGKMIDFANGAWTESNQAISENEQRMLEAKKATAEYKQTLSDISGELSQFGVTFSEEFKEKLALDDTGMVNSVVEAFDKMKNQTQLSSAELQQLFANVAPGMSASFINALSNQDPAIQAQVAATMANIASGAQVAEGDVKLIFSSIGYDLPQETINAFASQGGAVQSSVIDLLSHVSNGSSLVSENLYTLFRSFGVGLPNSMIEEIEGMDAETQQAAINLLLQLESGCNMSKDEIIGAFVDLGLRIPEGLQDSIESGNASTYLKGQELLNQLSNAANAAERARIVKEYNDLGSDIISDGLIYALNSKDETVKNEAAGLIKQVTLATTGEEREAAIAALNKFAEDFVDEGFIGPIKKISDEKMPGAAKDSVTGYTKGLGDNLNLVETAAGKIGDATESGTRKSLESHSPSKRMMLVGKDVILGIIEGFSASINQWITQINKWATTTLKQFQTGTTNMIKNIKKWFSEIPGTVYTAISPVVSKVTKWGSDVFKAFQQKITQVVSGTVKWFSEMPSKIYTSISKFITQTLPQWKSRVDTFFSSAIPKIISNVVNLFGGIGNRLVSVGENIVKGLWNGISNLTGWIGDKISGFCAGILKGFKKGFDEHSPSKEAFKIGDLFTVGLQKGLVYRFSNVYDDVEELARDINSIRIEPLIPDLSVPQIPTFTPRYSQSDIGNMKATMQMELDERMAQQAYENRRLQDAVERNTQILEKILARGIVLDDENFTDRYKRAATKFIKQHNYEMGLYPAVD